MQPALRGGNIQLHHFLAGKSVAHIGHLGLQKDLSALYSYLQTLGLKFGITQTKAKGESRLHTEGIKIAVAHIDAFPIIFLLEIPVEGAVFHSKRNVGILLCPAVRQLAGRGHRTAEEIGHRIAALRTRLADVQNRIDTGNFLQEAHIHRTAAVDHQHKFLIMRSAEGNGRLFFLRQIVITGFRLPIAALTGLTAQHIDAAVGIGYLRNGRPHRQAEIVEQHIHNGADLQEIQPFFLFFPIGCVGFFIEGFVIGDPFLGEDLKTAVFHTLQNGHRMPLVNLTGAGAALDRALGAGAIKGHFLRCKRQCAVIFQKNHTLASCFIGHLPIVQFPLIGFLCPMRPGQKFHNHTSAFFLLLYHRTQQKERTFLSGKIKNPHQAVWVQNTNPIGAFHPY